MKKRVLTLALSAALALSSTSAFAAETNCTRLNNIDYSNLLKNIVVKTSNNQYKIILLSRNSICFIVNLSIPVQILVK